MSYIGPSITLTPAEMEQKLEEAKRKALRMTAFPFKEPKPVVDGNILNMRFRTGDVFPPHFPSV